MSGIDEAVLKNIEACKQLAVMVRTSMGPNGMNKMVINHLEKLFVTSDARTIVTELEVQHPAAKMERSLETIRRRAHIDRSSPLQARSARVRV